MTPPLIAQKAEFREIASAPTGNVCVLWQVKGTHGKAAGRPHIGGIRPTENAAMHWLRRQNILNVAGKGTRECV